MTQLPLLTRRHVAVTAAGVLTLAAALAGCGGSASSGSSASGSSSSNGSVTIGVATPVAAFALPYLAQEQGYFAKHGVKVKVEVLAPGVLTPALVSGKIPFAVFASPQIEATNLTAPSVGWLGTWEKTANIGMVAAPGIKTVADLKGHKVGVTIPGSEASVLTDTALASAGLSDSDVQKLQLSSSSSELAAFVSGQIDAFICSQPLQSQAIDQRKGSTVVDPFDTPWSGAGLGGNLPYAKAHPGTAKAVLAALNDALKDWKSNKADAVKAINAIAPGTSQAGLDLTYQATVNHFTDSLVAPDQQTEQYVLTSMKKFGYPNANPDNWAKVVDGSYLPSASASTSGS